MFNQAVRADEEWLDAAATSANSSSRMFTSESYYRGFWELAEHGIVIMDRNKNIIEANPAFVQMVGVSAAELEGRNVADFINPRNWNGDCANMNALIKGRCYSYTTEENINHFENNRVDLLPVRVIVTRVPSTLTDEFQHFVAQIYKIERAIQIDGQPFINYNSQTYGNIFKNLLSEQWFVKTALWFLCILVIMLTLSGNLMPIIEKLMH